MKYSLHLPKFHYTKHLLILVGLVIVAGIVLLGAAEAVHDKNVSNARALQAAQAQVAKDKQVTALQAQNKALTAERDASCSYLKQLTGAKATKSLVTVPTLSGCVNP